MNKGKTSIKIDIKFLKIGIVIILVIIVIIFLIYYIQKPTSPRAVHHYEIRILNTNGEDVGGIHIAWDIKIENITITIIDVSSSVASSYQLSENTFECENSSLTVTYFDDNNDGLFSSGDFLTVSGNEEGDIIKIFDHTTGQTISESTLFK
jgi:hypothetical protein